MKGYLKQILRDNNLIEILTYQKEYKMGSQFLVQVPRQPKKKYSTNYISTTKYNAITFIPLSLLVQFKRYANIYFLICAILQSIAIISPLNPASAVAPLIFVLFLSMARQGYQDYKRWQSDKENNKSKTHVIEGKEINNYEWKKIKQGDIIRLSENQTVPADLLVLISSEKSGISYVETSSLDGEKNLKPKLSIPLLQQFYNNIKEIPNFYNLSGQVFCSEPAASNIEGFYGKINLKLGQINIEFEANKKYILHRGSKVKNTQWVIGLACYCGKETALMMGGNEARTKTSNIERLVNKMIIAVFIFEILCSIGSAVYCYFQCLQNLPFEKLIRNGQTVNCLTVSAITLGSYYILYNTFIPISLIVSLEFVKVFQGIFMQRDRQLYCGLNDRKAECHTVSINEQLGQVEYILTDKTGTLTCNRMQFRNIVVGDQLYGQDLIRKEVQPDFDFGNLSRRYTASSKPIEDSRMFDSSVLSFELNQQKQAKKKSQTKKPLRSKQIQEIFFAISTCHECIASGGHYQGPSPDEVALLKAAKKVGFQFISTQNKVTKVKYNNEIYTFKILKVIEFDSVRKRMTVVLQTPKTIKVYVKGADTSVEKLLFPNQSNLQSIKQRTSEMSRTGLRSLWFAYKQYDQQTRVQGLSIDQIEKGLTLLGASGIEDRLQDFVPQTIYALREGGIKFIMLTGDKLETAENIAISCRLIDQGFLIDSQHRLKAFIEKLQGERRKSFSFTAPISPVIDGSTLSFTQTQNDLLHIIPRVNSMVFCRVTPAQKAQIVQLVKKLGKITLAVGDGANDTNMIMQADVGVGIFGQEGTRAAQVSNYAIGEFCLLWKLLLHYGRLNYMRISEMIFYSFYKNMVFTIVQFAYCFYNGSGQSFWSSWPITLFNLLFTFFPVVLRAVFEVDLEITSDKKTFKQISQGKHHNQLLYSYYPKMYFIGQKNTIFTKLNFFYWFALGMSQGVICFIVTLYSLGTANDNSGFKGYQSGLSFVEISAYTSVIIIVTLKIAINIKQWNLILIIGFLVPSFGGYVAYRILFNYISLSDVNGYLTNLLSMPSFYLCQMLCIMGMFSFDFFLFSLEATKANFQNYLKFRTIRQRKLSQSHLNKFVLEMQTVQFKKSKLLQY